MAKTKTNKTPQPPAHQAAAPKEDRGQTPETPAKAGPVSARETIQNRR